MSKCQLDEYEKKHGLNEVANFPAPIPVIHLNLLPALAVVVPDPFFGHLSGWQGHKVFVETRIAVHHFKRIFSQHPQLVVLPDVGEAHVGAIPQ